ncbi:MAG: NADH-quinone oxidoreductase subunit N, partial [Deltaproteobacteria bacterium]|nr:NADH-quinone oxidoreductase subunit N [Deltaproteobacteria bacterium]
MGAALGNGASLVHLVPEGILAAAVGVLMAFGAVPRLRGRATVAAAAIGGLGAALLAAVLVPWPEAPLSLFHGMLVSDGMLAVFRPMFVLTGLFAIVFAAASDEVDSRDMADAAVLVTASVLGMCLMAGASDLLMAYLAMEFVGILSYVLAGLRREDQRSSEAALKYVIYGGAASGVMLFGMSLLYGIAGDTSFAAVRAVLTGADGAVGAAGVG